MLLKYPSNVNEPFIPHAIGMIKTSSFDNKLKFNEISQRKEQADNGFCSHGLHIKREFNNFLHVQELYLVG
jgi:hypothetical protein